jgi:hydroxymethylpyrimidine kinase/phosphomethylpyrimidine kinase/thiamine-phosphate diphosphorylase
MNEYLMTPPIVWSIAGSDSGAGAGSQADLKAFEAMDVHGCTAMAAITAQNTVAVERVDAVATDLLDAQLAALASDLPPSAIKTGLLGSVENIRCIAGWVDKLRSRQPVALVVDPVWRASTGATFSSDALRQALLSELLPRATVITPNRAEAAWLLGQAPDALASHESVEKAATALRALGPQAVVITGGDAGGSRSLDWMDTPQAQGWLSLPRIDTFNHHGSGCVFASTLTAALALGFCSADAAVVAKMSTTHALRAAMPAGRGAGAVRPLRGFGLYPELLPALHTTASFNAPPFLPLAQRHMGLYAVVDSANWVERVLDAGVRTVQLRIKADSPRQLSAAQLSQEIQHSVRVAQAARAQLFINDHWELALEHGAYGVHLGQEDLQTADIPALRAAGLRLGLSTHSYWEVCRASAWRPSYIACGPIHATTTKDMPWWPQGSDNLAYWCHLLRTPVVAIAGMDIRRSQEAVRCGAAGIAVLRGITQDADPERAIEELQTAINDATGTAAWPVPALPRSTLAGPVPPPWRVV